MLGRRLVLGVVVVGAATGSPPLQPPNGSGAVLRSALKKDGTQFVRPSLVINREQLVRAGGAGEPEPSPPARDELWPAPAVDESGLVGRAVNIVSFCLYSLERECRYEFLLWKRIARLDYIHISIRWLLLTSGCSSRMHTSPPLNARKDRHMF